MNKAEYLGLLQAADLISEIPNDTLSGSMLNQAKELRMCFEEYTKNDDFLADRLLNLESKIKQPAGLGVFILEFGKVTQTYIDMLQWNNINIPVCVNDEIVTLHIDTPTTVNNSSGLCAKELFISGLEWTQKSLAVSSQRPLYIVCFSYLSQKLSNKYPIFKNYPLSKTFQYRSGPHLRMLKSLTDQGFGDINTIKELSIKIHSDPTSEDILQTQKTLSFHQSAKKLLDKYVMEDISYAVATTEDFLAYDFS